MIGEEKASVAISGRSSHKMTGLFSQCFGRIFAFFRIPSLKKEIVARLLKRKAEAERFLGGFADILEHF